MANDLSNRTSALNDLHEMLRIRALEDQIVEFVKQREIVGSVHLCNGQEAIYVGGRSALQPDDCVFSTYRGHGWAMASGVPPIAILAELLAREGGINKGRGGSAFFSAADYGFYGENSIVGAGTTLACGAALTAKVTKSGRIALSAFGDGATNQGAVHEAMNLAASMKLPVLFLCENNLYAELTPYAETVAMTEIFRRADAYGMPGVRIDGNDPQTVRETVAEYAARARAGDGPALLEVMTQRTGGHYLGDIEAYRPKGELAKAKLEEPIVRLRAALIETGTPSEALDQLAAEATDEIARAAREALAQPLSEVSEVLRHVYEDA